MWQALHSERVLGWERKVPAGQATQTLSFPWLVQGVCRNFPGGHWVQHRPAEWIQLIPEGQEDFTVDLRGRLGGSTRPCWLRSMEQSWQPGGCDPLASSHSAARSTCGQGEGRLQRAWVQSEHPRAVGLGHCAHQASSHAQWAPEPQAKLNLQGVRPTDAGTLQGWQQGRTARGSPVPTAPGLGMPHGSPCAGLSPRSLSNWFPDLSIGHTPCGHMGHPAGLRQTSAARRHSARRWPSASPALSPTQCAVQGSGGLTPPSTFLRFYLPHR